MFNQEFPSSTLLNYLNEPDAYSSSANPADIPLDLFGELVETSLCVDLHGGLQTR